MRRRLLEERSRPANMAQHDDGSGRAPVVIVRPTTSVTSGVAVTKKLVGAAVAVALLFLLE